MPKLRNIAKLNYADMHEGRTDTHDDEEEELKLNEATEQERNCGRTDSILHLNATGPRLMTLRVWLTFNLADHCKPP